MKNVAGTCPRDILQRHVPSCELLYLCNIHSRTPVPEKKKTKSDIMNAHNIISFNGPFHHSSPCSN